MKFHLIIGTKDADIAYWMNHLPKGCFSHYVVAILSAEAKKKIAILPVPDEPGLLDHAQHASIYFESKQIEELLANVRKGKKGDYVKKVIRKHLNANYRRVSVKKSNDEIPEKVNTEVNKEQETFENNAIKQVVVKTEISVEEKTNTGEHPVNDFRARMLRMTKR